MGFKVFFYSLKGMNIHTLRASSRLKGRFFR